MSEADFHCGTMSPAHDALDRMKRASDRGTGCRLTADMVEALSRTAIGEMWEQDDPRKDPA